MEREIQELLNQKAQVIEELQKENQQLVEVISMAENSIMKMLELAVQFAQEAEDGEADISHFRETFTAYAIKVCAILGRYASPDDLLSKEEIEKTISGISLDDKFKLLCFIRKLKRER